MPDNKSSWLDEAEDVTPQWAAEAEDITDQPIQPPEPKEESFLDKASTFSEALAPEIPVISPLMRKAGAATRAGLAEVGEVFGLAEEKPYKERFEEYTSQAEESKAKAQEEFPITSTGTDVLGAAGVPGGLLAGAGVVATDTAIRTGGDIKETAKQTGMALAGGTLLKGLGKGVSKVLETKSASKAAEKAAGLSSSKKLLKEALSAKGIGKYKDGEIGDLLLKERVISPFSSSRTIFERIDSKLSTAGEDINRLIKNTTYGVETKKIREKLFEKLSKTRGVGSQTDKVRKVISNEGEKFDKLLQDGNKRFLSPEDIMAEKRRLGQAFSHKDITPPVKEGQQEVYKALNESIKETIEETSGKAAANKFTDLNKKAEMLILSKDAAMNQALAKGGLADVGGDISLAHGNLGAAVLLKNKNRLKHHADTLITAGLNLKSKIFGNQKWSNAIAEAADRGGSKAVATTHMLLMRRDPKYREAYNKEQKEKAE